MNNIDNITKTILDCLENNLTEDISITPYMLDDDKNIVIRVIKKGEDGVWWLTSHNIIIKLDKNE